MMHKKTLPETVHENHLKFCNSNIRFGHSLRMFCKFDLQS